VARWRVLGGPSAKVLLPLEETRKTNFETEITLASEPRYVAVQALSASGHVLGTSQARVDPGHSGGNATSASGLGTSDDQIALARYL
jgi:hypothetical protein